MLEFSSTALPALSLNLLMVTETVRLLTIILNKSSVDYQMSFMSIIDRRVGDWV